MSKKKEWILSKSACEKYLQCPAGFDYHYNQKIRPIRDGSALMFGVALDAALNSMLEGNKDPMSVYRAEVSKYELGKVEPGKYDFDGDLLSDEDRDTLLRQAKGFGYKGKDIDGLYHTLFDKFQNKERLSDNQWKVMDLVCRRSLERKAEIMLEAYREEVMPYITKVYNIQQRTESGILDATVEWKGRGKIIIDNKTSGRLYPDNSIDYSLQLALYAYEEKVRNVAYIVLVKNIQKNKRKTCSECGYETRSAHKTCNNEIDGKRCGGEWNETIMPKAEIQIVHGSISDEAIKVALETRTEIKRAIDAKIFPCNFPQCNNQYGKPCVYRDLKWKGSMEGLEVKESSWKKKS